jgi:hypothetical protein
LFLYAIDFRTGKNIFARKLALAAELDGFLLLRSGGKKPAGPLQTLLVWGKRISGPLK